MAARKATGRKKQETAPLTILGGTGLPRWGGNVDHEFHPRLRGQQGYKIFREMRENDPLIGGILWAIENLIKRAEWRVDPSDDTNPQAQAEAEFLDGVLFSDMAHTFEDFLSESLSMLTYGWAYFEIVWKLRHGDNDDPTRRSEFDDGRVGVRKLAPRSQDSLEAWRFDDDGGIRGLEQRVDSGQPVFIPIEKSLLFRTTSELGNPEGRSMLRNAYRPWFFKTHLEQIEAIGIERDLTGLPRMEVPPEIMSPSASPAHQALRASLQTMVEQIRRDEREGLVLPAEEIDGKKTGYRFSLVTTGGRRAIDPDTAITRHEQRMAMSVLAEFLLLGMDKVGSFALAHTKTTLFGAALSSVMDHITSVLNRFLVDRLMRLNGVPKEIWPRLVHGDASETDLAALADYVEKLVVVKAITIDGALERHLRMVGGLPEPEEGDPEAKRATNGSGKPLPGDDDANEDEDRAAAD